MHIYRERPQLLALAAAAAVAVVALEATVPEAKVETALELRNWLERGIMKMMPRSFVLLLNTHSVLKALFYLSIFILITCLGGLLIISSDFSYSTPWLSRPTTAAVSLLMTAGLGYLLLLWVLSNGYQQKNLIVLMVIVGACLRLMWVASTPIYEDDFYRYFFDGAMVSNGLNPYIHAPSDALPNDIILDTSSLLNEINTEQNENKTSALLNKIAEDGPVDRVAYPYIRTIYPPITQAFFTLNHHIAPWSIKSWRIILFIVDCVSLLLLFKLIRVTGKRDWMSMIFWLNPLVITETMNAGHMDALLLPFLIGVAILSTQKKYGWAGTVLAGAVGVKLWPAILAPILFGKFLKKPVILCIKALPFLILSGLFVLPQILARLDTTAGLAAYAESWHVNAFAFSLIEQTLAAFSDDSNMLARLTVLGLIVSLVLWQLRNHNAGNDITKTFLIISTALFLLSPTGYPWYFIWLMPWLVLHPSAPLLLLTVSLSLYDLRYPLSLDETQDIFNSFVVPLEFAPTIAWLLIGAVRRKPASSPA